MRKLSTAREKKPLPAHLRPTFGQLVAGARREAGLTQGAAAAKAGLSQNYWSSLEADQRDPPLSTVRRVAAALGVQPAQLLAD